MKGYSTSKDYEKLYTLAKNGYRILGWVTEKFYETDINICVEIKLTSPTSEEISIGTKGHGYGFNDSKKEFLKSCNYFKLEYIEPNNI